MAPREEVNMQTIAVVSQKGGAGKTTLAIHLAVLAARDRVTLIVDTDPQATASRWGQWRGDAEPEVIDCGAPSLLAGKLAKAETLGAEVVVIDTPPHADAMARAATRLADLILIPCRPRAFDLAALDATADLVRASGKPAYVVFNAGPPRARRIYQEAEDLVGRGFGLAIAPARLPERAAFHHSTAQGRTAPEQVADGQAAADMRALWAWTQDELRRISAGTASRTGIPA
jgi:chromosome partitioning protein